MSFCTVNINEVNAFGVALAMSFLRDAKTFDLETIPVHVAKYLLEHVKSQAEFIDSATGKVVAWHLYRNADPLAAEVPILALTQVDGLWRVHSYDVTIPQ